jgi:RNA polymerase sigma factor for flagellar operon FliA
MSLGGGIMDREEAQAYGIEGLIKGVDSFDPDRGISFLSFAHQRIRGSILDALRKSDVMSRGLRSRVREVEQACQELGSLLGRWPTSKEIALKLNLPLEEVRYLQDQAGTRVYSLDRLRSGDENGESSGWEPCDDDDLVDPADALDQKELFQALQVAIGRLRERDREVIEMRYRQSRSLSQIAGHLGISESRVSQIHKSALRKLRDLMTEEEDGAALAA